MAEHGVYWQSQEHTQMRDQQRPKPAQGGQAPTGAPRREGMAGAD